jgi:hypothetical protein
MYETASRAGVVPKRRWFDTRKRFKARAAAARTPRDAFNEAFAPILKQPVDKVVQEILEYVEEAYTDADDSDDGAGEKSHCAFEVSIAHEFAKHYGYRVDFWDATCPADKNPLLVPLKIVFQLRKLRAEINGGRDSIVTNKSDRLISDGLGKMSERN